MSLPSVDAPLPSGTSSDHAVAVRHAPVLMVDLREPAMPLALGYSVYSVPGQSPSSKFHIAPPEGGTVIEYAVWYDWDIEHLYDLEHVWVHLDRDGAPYRVEASMHGMRVSMDRGTGLPQMQGDRPVLYAEPGKHAMWAYGDVMPFAAGQMIRTACGPLAGQYGVHTGNRFAQTGAFSPQPMDHRLARLAMKRAAFAPSFRFQPAPPPALVPWPALEAWIPDRMTALMASLPNVVPHLAAVFLDCGDTLIDESTEQKIPGTEVVTEAEEIPDAMEAVRALKKAGHRLALVADGPRATFENLLKPRGIWDLMETHAISGDVGVHKPDAAMFDAALRGLGLDRSDAGRIVMVGNNLPRDIAGANALGMHSLFVAWSHRRSHVPATEQERPDHRIDRLSELSAMIETIELALPEGGRA